MWSCPPRRILVAVDFGEASTNAARIAGELARRFRATLTAVHAESFEVPAYFTADQTKTLERERRLARSDADRYLREHVQRHASVPAETIVAEGTPAAIILRAAAHQDLIVMGTHGRRGPARWWAGSVAERVVRQAKVPTLVVRADSGVAAAIFARVTVVANRSAAEEAVRRCARTLSAAFGGDCVEGEIARSPSRTEGSLIALPPPMRQAAVFGERTEKLLRACRRPVLFVPAF